MLSRKTITMAAAAVMLLAGMKAQAQTTINFDDVPVDTVINSHYSGLTFTAVATPIGSPNVYARRWGNTNVVTLISSVSSSLPLFDRRDGGVQVVFNSPQAEVSLDAAPVLPPEFLTTPTNKPFLQAYDAAGNFLGVVYYPLNYGQSGYGTYQKLSFSFPDNRIKTIQFSSQYNGAPAVYGVFDNLTYKAVSAAKVSRITLSTAGTIAGAKPYPTGSVTLTAAAPAGGAVVNLSSNKTSASVPVSVTVPAGQISAPFVVTTSALTTSTTATITATAGGVSKTASLLLAAKKISGVNSGGNTSVTGWTKDIGYTGGATSSTKNTINTSKVTAVNATIYSTDRNGTFTYTLKGLTNGASYVLRLHFAEYGNVTKGQRLFNILVNGTQIASRFDIVNEAGAINVAIAKEYKVSPSSGQIIISFQPVTTAKVPTAKLSGLELYN